MTETFDIITEYFDHLAVEHSDRVEKQDDYLDDYLMQWSEESEVKNKMQDIKIIKSPDVRNRIQGASRLLSATKPQFSIPAEMNEGIDEDALDNIEKVADRMFQAASRVANNPIEYDIALSLNLFGETHIGITRTTDLVSQANKKDHNKITEAAVYRAEEIARITPYMYDVWDPRKGFPDLDNLGLKAYGREVETTVGAVLDEFGKDAEPFFTDPVNRYTNVTLRQLWDWQYRYVWINGESDFLYMEPHGLPFIPITVQLGEGSLLFEDPEFQRQPMGYTVVESGLSNIQNLSLTLMYTALMKTGANPQWISEANQRGDYAMPDFSVMAGVWKVPHGGKLVGADLRNAVNPQISEMLNLADNKVQESTIYSQTLGEPLGGGNAPFSSVALLHQAGRLPLLIPQKKGGRAIAEVVKKSLVWMKKEKPKGYGYKHILGDLKTSEIPDHFELDCKLEVSLPQDELQNANIASRMREGDRPLVSDAWILENVLNIKQPGGMQKQIWDEQAANLDARAYFADQEMRVKEMEKQATTPQQPPAPQQAKPGQPLQPGAMQGDLPPVMEQAGMQPPQPVPGAPPKDGVIQP